MIASPCNSWLSHLFCNEIMSSYAETSLRNVFQLSNAIDRSRDKYTAYFWLRLIINTISVVGSSKINNQWLRKSTIVYIRQAIEFLVTGSVILLKGTSIFLQ